MLIFIIPVYNESPNLKLLTEKIAKKVSLIKMNYKLIFVDDGSTDDTVEQIKRLSDSYPLEFISYFPNKGPGAAFSVGFNKALEISCPDDIIVTLEADNTSDLSILEMMITRINQGYDLALASCYAQGGGVIGTVHSRIFLSKAANLLLKLVFPVKGLHTFTSFYRTYRADSLAKLKNVYGDALIRQKGFESMIEILVKFCRNKEFRVTEVPTILDATMRKGKSKMKILKTIKGALIVIWQEGISNHFRWFNRTKENNATP